MTKIIAISNHKGGVGKTTSSVNIGAGLSILKRRVLLIDLDPQANMSQSLGINNPDTSIYESLRDQNQLDIVNLQENLDIVPSTLDLSGAEIELSSETGREYILAELIEPIKSNYDYIIIDCPPSLGLLTVNAMAAADEVIIPLQAQFLAMKGLTKIVEVIDKVKKRVNKNLKIGGIFVTQYDKRKVLHRDVVETIPQLIDKYVFKTKIRDNISLAEAPSTGLDIFRYNPKSFGAEDYLDLCKEIIELHNLNN